MTNFTDIKEISEEDNLISKFFLIAYQYKLQEKEEIKQYNKLKEGKVPGSDKLRCNYYSSKTEMFVKDSKVTVDMSSHTDALALSDIIDDILSKRNEKFG